MSRKCAAITGSSPAGNGAEAEEAGPATTAVGCAVTAAAALVAAAETAFEAAVALSLSDVAAAPALSSTVELATRKSTSAPMR